MAQVLHRPCAGAAASWQPASAVCSCPVSSIMRPRPTRRNGPCVAASATVSAERTSQRVEEVHATTYELVTDTDLSKEFMEYSRATQQLQELTELQAELMSSVADVDSWLAASSTPSDDAEAAEAAELRRAKRQQARAARKGATAAPAARAHAVQQLTQSPVAAQAAARVAPAQPAQSVAAVPQRVAAPQRTTTKKPSAQASAVSAQAAVLSAVDHAPSSSGASASATVHPNVQAPAPVPRAISAAPGLSLPTRSSGTAQKLSQVRSSRGSARRAAVAEAVPLKADNRSRSTGGLTDSTTQFMRNMGGVALLTPEEQRHVALLVKDFLSLQKMEQELASVLKRKPTLQELAKAIKSDPRDVQQRMVRGQEAKKHMVQANYRLVVSVVKKYQGRGLAMQDLITEGVQGLLRGVEKFEVDKGFRFSTYAHWWIRQAVTRAVQEQSRAVRMPVHMQEQLSRVKLTFAQLSSELGRMPSMEEVAAVVNIPVEKIQEMMTVNNQGTSLEAAVTDDDGGSTLKDMIADERMGSEEVFENDMIKVGMDSVLAELNEREASVLRMHWGLDGGPELTLEEIGSRLGVTRERVRQLEARALQRLRARQAELAGVLGELQGVSTSGDAAGPAGRASRGTRKT